MLSNRLTKRLLKVNGLITVKSYRCYSDERIVDKLAPGILSPFDNPRRVYKAQYSSAENNKKPEVTKKAVPQVEPATEPVKANDKSSEETISEPPEEKLSQVVQKQNAMYRIASSLRSLRLAGNNSRLLSSVVPDQSNNVDKEESIKLKQKTGYSYVLKEEGNERISVDELTKMKNEVEHDPLKAVQEVSEDERKKQKVERNTRLGMLCLVIGSTCGFFLFCFYYGRSRRDEAGNVIVDAYSNSVLAPFYRIADGFRDWMNYAVEPAREKLLPDPLKAPYIQPKYTLVIEMKNVLVSPEWTYKTGYRFKKRPALDYFLDVVGYPNFELVIYTSEPPMSAFSVVDSFDPKQRIMYRLFRDCTKYQDGHHIKDLNRLNRDLSKVIFIDFDAQSAKLNPENVLRVPKWEGDMDDTALVDLAELLKTIHLSDTEDVRPTLQYYSSFDNPPAEFRRRAIELAEFEQQQKQKKEDSSLRKYAGFFGFRRHQNV
ncbi:unnamed protein product [Bursaphelenchus okinawaensis]|uniref:Mitochondrial import inner membrane translocase subunit TIM50 n=1 Tax=Bursaphelenchus okinawaensis TaxID=465554 RepID=A0A811LBW7_9BILA|nr:unnamed protein product [Bursaphelenchus okinawaensis]CAG9120403.1 unnamed protein product [Bursaphelenchus okinawaensis]